MAAGWIMLKPIKDRLKTVTVIRQVYERLCWQRRLISDWFNTSVRTSKVQRTTPFGFKLVSKRFIANLQMLEGNFEKDEIEAIRSCMEKAEVFIDIGANIGFYTCLARSLGKQVLAVEPQPQNLECLCQNVATNGWSDVEIFPVGLSDKPGLLTLYGASGPSASLISGWAGYSAKYQRLIPVNTLDALLGNRFQGKNIFIKVDVEGAEFGVLQGALHSIQNLRPKPVWFIEVAMSDFHPGGVNPNYAATFDLFLRNGYEAFVVNQERTPMTAALARDIASKGSSPYREFNYLFVPNAGMSE